MNPLFLIFIGLPALEIFFMIKIGAKIGALNTISLVFLTAIIGLYFARLEGIRTLKSGITNLYRNKIPIEEILSGASIAIAAILLIVPGFLTDAFGFFLLIPFSRKILISFFIKKDKFGKRNTDEIVDGEIIENKDKKDEI